MKKFTLLVLLLLTIGQTWAQKPFQNAIIFPGGGFKIGMHLGSYHSLINAGIRPDLLIGACGGSLATAIIERFPDSPQKQVEFLLSREVHQKLLAVQVTEYGKTFKTLETYGLSLTTHKVKNYYFLERYLLEVPQDLAIFGNHSFKPKSETKSFASIIQSVEYVRNDRKPFEQVYFTDEQTGKYLENYRSSVAAMYKESRLKKTTKVMTEFNLNMAVRSSIADPYLMYPFQHGDKMYLTGAIDVLPLDMASKLADNTYYLYKNDMPKILDTLFMETFGSSMLDKVGKERPADLPLMTDTDISNYTMDPAFKVESGIDSTVPEVYEEYYVKMKGQYEAAFNRSTEVISAQKAMAGAN